MVIESRCFSNTFKVHLNIFYSNTLNNTDFDRVPNNININTRVTKEQKEMPIITDI